MSTALGKVCAACGIERRRKGVLYHPETFLPYCEHAFYCNNEHPNSPKNLIDRGAELQLIPLEEAQERFKKWLALNHPDQEKADKIRRMVTQPVTIRIGSPELAQFILDIRDEYGLGSISDTIRYCVEQVKLARGTFIHERKELEKERDEQRQAEETQQEIQQAVAKPAEPELVEPELDDDFLGTF